MPRKSLRKAASTTAHYRVPVARRLRKQRAATMEQRADSPANMAAPLLGVRAVTRASGEGDDMAVAPTSEVAVQLAPAPQGGAPSVGAPTGGRGAPPGASKAQRRLLVESKLHTVFSDARASMERDEQATPTALRRRAAWRRAPDAQGAVHLVADGEFTEERRQAQLADIKAVLTGTLNKRPEEAWVLGMDDFTPGFDRANRDAVKQLCTGIVSEEQITRLLVNMGGVVAARYEHGEAVNVWTDFHSNVEPRLVQRPAGAGPGTLSVPASVWEGRTDAEHELLYEQVAAFLALGILEDCGSLDACPADAYDFLSNAYVESKQKEDGTMKHRMVFSDIYGNLFISKDLPATIRPLREMLTSAPMGARIGVVDGSKFFCTFELSEGTRRRVAFVFRHGLTGRFHVARARGMLFGEAYGPSVGQDLTSAEAQCLEHHGLFAGAVIDDLAAGATTGYIDTVGSAEQAHANVAYLLLALPAIVGVTDAAGKSQATPRTVATYRGVVLDFEQRRVIALPSKLRRVQTRTCELIGRAEATHELPLGVAEKWLSTVLALSDAVNGVRMFTASWLDALGKTGRTNTLVEVRTRGSASGAGPPVFVPTPEAARRKNARARWHVGVTQEMLSDAAQLMTRFEEAGAAASGAHRRPGLPFSHEHHLTVTMDGRERMTRQVQFMDFDASLSHWGAVIYLPGQEPVRHKAMPRKAAVPGTMPLRAAGVAAHYGGDFRLRFSPAELEALLIRQAEAEAVVAAFEQAILSPVFRAAAAGARFIGGEDNTNWLWMWLKGGSHDPVLRRTAKRLWEILHELGATIEFRYVESARNPADDPTRPSPIGEAHLDAAYFEPLAEWARQRTGGQRHFSLDACASASTAQRLQGAVARLPHISRFPEGHGRPAHRANVLKQHLGDEFAYVFPPAVIAEQVLEHALWCGGAFVIVLQRDVAGGYIGRWARASRSLARFVACAPSAHVWRVAAAGQACLTIPSGQHGNWTTYSPSFELIAVYVAGTVQPGGTR